MSAKKKSIIKNNLNIFQILSIYFIIYFYRKFYGNFKKIFFKNRKKICSYYPTCSEYSIIAIKKYGFRKGWFLTFKRIKKCNSFSHNNSCIDFP